LLVQCEFGVVVLDEEWDEIIQALRAALRTEPHRFREVVLVEVGKRVATLSGRVGRAQRRR
jgi:osmotically-inducible protein OsmY